MAVTNMFENKDESVTKVLFQDKKTFISNFDDELFRSEEFQKKLKLEKALQEQQVTERGSDGTKPAFQVTFHVPRASDLDRIIAKQQGNMRQKYIPPSSYNTRIEERSKHIVEANFETKFHLPNNQTLRLHAFKSQRGMFAGEPAKIDCRDNAFDPEKYKKEGNFVLRIAHTSNKWANQELSMLKNRITILSAFVKM